MYKHVCMYVQGFQRIYIIILSTMEGLEKDYIEPLNVFFMAEILYNLFKAFTWITYTLCKLLIELYSQFKIYPIHNMNPLKAS